MYGYEKGTDVLMDDDGSAIIVSLSGLRAIILPRVFSAWFRLITLSDRSVRDKQRYLALAGFQVLVHQCVE